MGAERPRKEQGYKSQGPAQIYSELAEWLIAPPWKGDYPKGYVSSNLTLTAICKFKYKMKKELLIGCGSQRDKRLALDNDHNWSNLTTLDINDHHNPDVVWDLCQFPLPFEDNTFDEIHAYEVLEHTGQQGDYKFFFAQFTEFWRILKPNGYMFATCPAWNSIWAWGDPSHTRVLQNVQLNFLSQKEYTNQIGVTPMSDFRYLYKADFEKIYDNTTESTFAFVIQAVKPSRISI